VVVGAAAPGPPGGNGPVTGGPGAGIADAGASADVAGADAVDGAAAGVCGPCARAVAAIPTEIPTTTAKLPGAITVRIDLSILSRVSSSGARA